MKARWKKGLVKITLWLIAETILNLLELDLLADYSEFIFERKLLVTLFLLKPRIATIASCCWLDDDSVFPATLTGKLIVP